MFEFLSTVEPEQAIRVVNITIRMLERLEEPSFMDSPDETKLVFRVLTEIQRSGLPFYNLPLEVSNKFVSELAQIATERISTSLSIKELKRGREILEDWKNEELSQMTEQISNSALESIEAKSFGDHDLNKRSAMLARYTDMSEDELRSEAARLRESLFRLNFKLALGEIDTVKKIRQQKLSLRRINTIMKNKDTERPH